jgi:hypothetical protein
MEKTKFKVGDRVKALRIVGAIDSKSEGFLGTVWEAEKDHSIGVRFDKDIGGHDLELYGRRCAMGHGWYVQPHMIKKVRRAATKKVK